VVAAADPAPPTEAARTQARALLQEGAREVEQGEYDQAIASFSDAYRLVASPKILFNLGIAYLALDRRADALRSFEGFLREATDAPAASLATARRHVDDLRAKVAELRIASDRPAADLTLDGHPLGPVTFDRPLIVDPGAHDLLARAGRDVVEQTFTAETGRPVNLTLTFAPTRAAAPRAEPPPAPSLAPVAPAATAQLGRSLREPPVYRRRWFWAVVGAGAALAVAAAVTIALSHTEYPAVDERVRGP
jgi:tetratricopeptide (TPR) repeat protein